MEKSNVPQEDVAGIMNRIDEALLLTDYSTVGYDNTDTFLIVIIDRKNEFEKLPKEVKSHK